MEISINLGQAIRNARERKGISRVKLAEFTGISLNALAKYENAGDVNGKYPAMIKMAKIAEVLEMDPRWVFEMINRNGDVELTRPFNFFFFFEKGYHRNPNSNQSEEESYSDYLMMEHLNEFRELKKELREIKAAIIKNGPDQKDPDRSKESTNETEAVEAASIREPKGGT